MQGNSSGQAMIRERRKEDIDLLCAVLAALDPPANTFPGKDINEWLREHDGGKSWVFDAAPVTVAPTQNVVGHVQIYKPAEESETLDLAGVLGKPAEDLLVIGKLFVRPGTHEYGIARYLLKESIKYVQGRAKFPVLDVHGNAFLSKAFCGKFGFEELPSARSGVTPMIYTK